ncbi:hypothetical protein [Streptomyces tsukubensis]|uniref:PRD domain-containing protein n=1 Tax=Streptomyces tsukubensis TaxID=83656 RepID=A0A1V3ZZF8_9ACTN|nr:hypothetical protein [Streptomyces tsukubensis]OON71895.1 hypothetical protein B1H18_32095 [Streptomyces tsukubensis]QFR91848.1 hypothetical protein GBW32_00780 [Streptomyces tsukubensis]
MTGTPPSATHPRLILDQLADDTHLTEEDRADAEELLTAADAYAAGRSLPMNDVRRLALAAHTVAFVRRVREHEYPPELDRHLYDEVGEEQLAAVRELLQDYCAGRDHTVTDPEVLLLTLHFEAALQESASGHDDSV